MNPPKHQTGYLRQPDARIFYQSWTPETMNNVMVIAHGLGEHSGRYQNVVEYFCPKGYGIYALDFRGHGQSSGTRGHVNSFEDYASDLASLVRKAVQETEKEKPILVGHSLGGLISVIFLLGHQEMVSSAVLSSPGLRTKEPPPKIKAALGKMLARILPSLTMSNEIDSTHISRDSKVVEAYQKDPLVHDQVSTKFFVEYLRASDRAFREAATLNLPFLLLQAGEDLLVNPEASREFFEKVDSPAKKMQVYENLYHEIFNEPEKKQVFSDMEAWLTTI